MTSVSIPASRARASPAASARFEITTATRAANRPAAIASRIAPKLLPRPEISTATLDFSTGWGTGLFSTVSACSGTGLQNARTRHCPCLVDSPWSDNAETTPFRRARHILPRDQSKRAKNPAVSAVTRLSRVSGPALRGPQTPPGSSARVLHHVESLAPRCGSCRPAAALQAAPLGINYPCGTASPASQDGRPRPCVSGAIQIARDRLARPTRPCVPLRRAKRAARAIGAARPGLALVQPLRTAER